MSFLGTAQPCGSTWPPAVAPSFPCTHRVHLDSYECLTGRDSGGLGNRLGEGGDWCKVIQKVSGRAGLFFALLCPPLTSFKYQAQSPGSLWIGSSRLRHSWPTPGHGGRGLGTSGVGSGQLEGTRRKTGFPQLDACCSPTPTPQGRLGGWKTTRPGWPLTPLAGFSPPHQCLPARVDSKLGSGNQSDHFAHFPRLLGRCSATSQGGVSQLGRCLGCPCNEWICPEGDRQRDTPALALGPSGRSPPGPPIAKPGGWKLHSQATSPPTRGVSGGGPDDPSQSCLLTSPYAWWLRRWLPWGRLQPGWDPELR